jgi:enoyl-CoA hydratase/carnithine racemase
MTGLLRAAHHGPVLRLTLHDPASRNSLSQAMMAALEEALAAAGADSRVIVLAGEGPVFCSGHNLKEITACRAVPDGGAAAFQELFDRCARLMQAIVNHPRPVIAEVAGLASAAGCQLVASCDLAVAAETASFCTPGVNIGLFCSTPMVALSRAVARKHAMEMLLTGAAVSAAEAMRMGLVNRVVGADELTATTLSLAERIAGKSALTVSTGKRAFYAQAEMPLAAAYDYAARVMTDNLLAHDAEEGIAAVLGKRPPVWEDR